MIEAFIGIPLTHIKGEQGDPNKTDSSAVVDGQNSQNISLEQIDREAPIEFFGLVAIGLAAIIYFRNKNLRPIKQEAARKNFKLR